MRGRRAARARVAAALALAGALVGAARAGAEPWGAFAAARCGGRGAAGCDVVVAAGEDVVLSGDAEAASVTVRGGRLRWDPDVPGVLRAGFVVAEEGGSVEMGSPSRPAAEGSRIHVLNNGRAHPVTGARSVGSVGPGARLWVFGRPLARTWFLLARPAAPGDRTLNLDGDAAAAGWRAGDRIAVAPTTSYPKDGDRSRAEVFTVEGVAGSTLSLDAPVAAARGGFPERRVQAEVLNLQRAVTITGDDFDSARHGLHVVAHSLAEAQVAYARVEKCGQLGVAGKYCLHFHQARACPSCLFLGNAIENSSQRGIIVHGTHRSRVEANVLYDIKGSGIYIEDGNEMENKIIDNVVLCPQKNNCKQPGTDNDQADDIQQSGLWALSVTNDFIGNRLVNHYNGFFTQTSAFPHGRGSAAGRVCTVHAPLGTFKDNVCHSNARFGFYLDNNYPRRLSRSVESNGMLSQSDFSAFIDGDQSTSSSCDAFRPDGSDNGVTGVVEGQLEVGNVFSGQYGLGDVQFLRWHSINNLHGLYWKDTKQHATGGIRAHVLDSLFEWIGPNDSGPSGRAVWEVLGSPGSGVAHIAGPGGLGAFVIENTRFHGPMADQIAAGQHCGLSGTGALCTPEYTLSKVQFTGTGGGSRMLRFGISDGNTVLPIFTAFDDSIPGGHAGVASKAQTHLLSIPGSVCQESGDARLDFGIACSVPLRRLQVWGRAQSGGALLYPPGGGAPWRMEHIGNPHNARKQGYGAAVAPGHRYILELDRDEGITIEFSDPVYGAEFDRADELELELRFRSQPGANRACSISSQHSRSFISGTEGPLKDGLGACTRGSPESGGGLGPAPAPACTVEGDDPWASREEVACCEGSSACLKDWEGNDRWYYLCKRDCGEAPPEVGGPASAPVPEAPAPVPEAPAPAPEGDPMRCGATDAERQVEASCDAVMGQPNPFSGEGYYLLDDSCLSRSSVGCIGQTGCRLCHTRPASRQGDSVYPWCPQCVCDKWGVSEAGACAPVSCTPAGSDPYASGQEVACCAGTVADLGDHDSTGRWFYLCSNASASEQQSRASSLPRLAAACEGHVRKKECKAAFASDGCLFLGPKRYGADAGCKSLADPRTCPLLKRRKTCQKSGCMWSGSCELPTVVAAGESTREGRCGGFKRKKCRQSGCVWLGRKNGGCSGTNERAASSTCAQKKKRACRLSGCAWLGRKNGGCSEEGPSADPLFTGE